MRYVLRSNFGKRADHRRFILDNRLENKSLPILVEDDPRVAIVFIAAPLKPLTHEKLCRVTQLDQLPPGPEGVVFAVALAKMLERSRVLPEVRFIEQLIVRQILALGEPLAYSADGYVPAPCSPPRNTSRTYDRSPDRRSEV
jgi:hypothetical protein